LDARSPPTSRRAKTATTSTPATPDARGESRVDAAYRAILRLITDRSLGVGDRLPRETEMAETFAISRPVVRQALARLQEAGVIEVRWGAGSYVRDRHDAGRTGLSFGPVQSLEEVRAAYELRAAVEGEAAALAAERWTSPRLAQLRAALAKLDKAVATDELGQQADLEFHFAIAAASHNPFFEQMLHSIRRPLEFSVGLARTLSLTFAAERIRIVQAEHVAIADAIAARDPERARRAMRAHLANACQRIFLGPGGATKSKTSRPAPRRSARR
jgi:GntR family transcriptional repressor for pyruvate dehydrogenase complex